MQEPGDDFGALQHVRREFERRKTAWTTLNEWLEKSGAWLHGPVSELKAEEVQVGAGRSRCNTGKQFAEGT